MTDKNQAAGEEDQDIAETGAYELIRKRLQEQGKQLEKISQTLNQNRLEMFGGQQLDVIGRARVRTENNCIPRDIVNVGEQLLFGYNVFIGLKNEIGVADVFSLYTLTETVNGIELKRVDPDKTFLGDRHFIKEFTELYNYYKNARLIHLSEKNGKIFASFQIGNKLSDIRVFRWMRSNEGDIQYIDDRGERDLEKPKSHDFEWTQTTREDQVTGDHPHINILDEIFVETIKGDLTIKVEDNTEDGLGIYREPVDDHHQSLDDASVFYTRVGTLILLKIKPYREEHWRYLVYNTREKSVNRIDAIGFACVQLPEDHGIIYPGGYYLQNGETKSFEGNTVGLEYHAVVKSPNGEDFLYIFYEPEEGRYALFPYNLIRKELQNPIYGHGYCLFEDGRTVVFKAESNEPTRVHPMQIWQTPFFSDTFASTAPADNSLMGRIGNADLVRGVSDFYSVVKAIKNQTPSIAVYEDLIATCRRMFDGYYWLNESELGHFEPILKQISETAELVLDEFEKIESIRAQARKALRKAENKQLKVLNETENVSWNSAEEYVTGLKTLREQRGHLISLKDIRFIDTAMLNTLEEKMIQVQAKLSEATVNFLSQDAALVPYHTKIEKLDSEVEKIQTVSQLEPLLESLNEVSQGMELLMEVITGLKISDTTVKTAIIEAISNVFSKLNRSKASASLKRKDMRSGEAVAEFGAQFQLFSQSVVSAISMADTPDKCDEQLSRLLIQLEELEAGFSDFDEFLTDLVTKREEVYESFEAKKQSLTEAQQRRAYNLSTSAERILENINKRAQRFADADALNTYFASDAMVFKVQEIVESLNELKDNVKADDVDAKLKSIKDQALRSIRDKQDIFEDGGNIIKLGRHRFSVSTQELDLTLLARGDVLQFHLVGTDYFEPIEDARLNDVKHLWNQALVSETGSVYRGEYLAYSILNQAEKGLGAYSVDDLYQALHKDQGLLDVVKDYASPRYNEGYEKGVHDGDAAIILSALLQMKETAGLLRFSPKPRAYAVIFWQSIGSEPRANHWRQQAMMIHQIMTSFGYTDAYQMLVDDIAAAIQVFYQHQNMACSDQEAKLAGQYLCEELQRDELRFTFSTAANEIAETILRYLDSHGSRVQYQETLKALKDQLKAQWTMTWSWVEGHLKHINDEKHQYVISEVVALLLIGDQVEHEFNGNKIEIEAEGLLGQHANINKRILNVRLDEFIARLSDYHQDQVPAFKAFVELRQRVLEASKEVLRLEEFKPHPLTSFVRNKLINEVYLPIVGDNLAKQMGSVGDTKRTDLMGMLLLISPPGYGKTTLMEYMANRLGLIFMKVNCPSIGHEVTSIDPADAPNATARQELNKLNLGLEMGNNVMLYLDDIQHTNPEFLQKFISLCDAQRKIEGVWKGKTKTYDLRGKKFCIIMAGNPYTESGAAFKIPDMLANRADIYNLGDILSGGEETFAMSYIENSLTSNPALAPLATRDMEDVYRFIRAAGGEQIADSEYSHQYSNAEANEIIQVIQKMTKVQEVVLKVNQQYIASAAQDDKYRTEPSFKLQGSYRNMNKMVEKVVAVMNDQELQSMIEDHYVGEAQTLTTGAEENLLKLYELIGNMSDEQTARWTEIKDDYKRLKRMGGDESDPITKAANQMGYLVSGMEGINRTLTAGQEISTEQQKQVVNIVNEIAGLSKALGQAQMEVQVINEPVPGLDTILINLTETIDNSLLPVVSAMMHKVRMDHDIWDKVKDISDNLHRIDKKIIKNKMIVKKTFNPIKTS